jgi:hypothetical protein
MNPRDFAFAGFSLFMMGMTLSSSQKLESRSREVTMLNHEIELHKTEAQVLRDQMADMTYQWSSKRTYEEGVMDGIHNAKSHEYMAGYHLGVSQLFEVPEEPLTSVEEKP